MAGGGEWSAVLVRPTGKHCFATNHPLPQFIIQCCLCAANIRKVGQLASRSLRQKRYSTGDSQEITQPSTNPAQPGLSCEF